MNKNNNSSIIKLLAENSEVEIRCSIGEDVNKETVIVKKLWNRNICNSEIINKSDKPIKLKEVVLFSGQLPFDPDTQFYGEGYSKLSQDGGTINAPVSIGSFTDKDHYKLPQKEGFFTVYNLAMFYPEKSDILLIAFSSCRRFSGEIRIDQQGKYEVVLDLENLTIAPNETWKLEEFFISEGNSREELLHNLAQRIEQNHLPLKHNEIPTGWCSWYCYGPDITQQDIIDNLNAIREKIPELKYIQIDDGYQAYMGDWLVPSQMFPAGIKELCKMIKSEGFEPAIWVAPFIAEKDSEIFKNHPDWFIKDENGNPLASHEVTFGGWRNAPWYMLDGTHPEAREYLTFVFSTMRNEWDCKYFKLDANVWGAMPFGTHYDKNATKVEAYRRGMAAILKGAGSDSFILGCNAPMWPSIGTVHGMRVTNDIQRKWSYISSLAKECFNRNWQNNRLWINDPDCVCIENLTVKLITPDGKETIKIQEDATKDELMFHAAYIFASGGMVLSGDKVMELSNENLTILKKLISGIGKTVIFENISFEVGSFIDKDEEYICIFNWGDYAKSYTVETSGKTKAIDYFTDMDLSISEGKISVDLPKHAGKVVKLK